MDYTAQYNQPSRTSSRRAESLFHTEHVYESKGRVRYSILTMLGLSIVAHIALIIVASVNYKLIYQVQEYSNKTDDDWLCNHAMPWVS